MSKLNPNAEPFVPATTQQRAEAGQKHAQAARQLGDASNGDERSLFMTFSNGSPVTWREIFEYFTSVYGQCVEHIYVHRRHDEDPKFGKLIFKTSNLPQMILQDREVVKISINSKPVWLKEYVPRSLRT